MRNVNVNVNYILSVTATSHVTSDSRGGACTVRTNHGMRPLNPKYTHGHRMRSALPRDQILQKATAPPALSTLMPALG